MTAQAVVGVAAFPGSYWRRRGDVVALSYMVGEMDRERLGGVDPVYLVVTGATIVLVIVMLLLLF